MMVGKDDCEDMWNSYLHCLVRDCIRELYQITSDIGSCLTEIQLKSWMPFEHTWALSFWRSGLYLYTDLPSISVWSLCVFVFDQVKTRNFTSYWKSPCEEGGARTFVWTWVLFFLSIKFCCLVLFCFFSELYDSVLGSDPVVLDGGIILKNLVEKIVSMLWCEKHKL